MAARFWPHGGLAENLRQCHRHTRRVRKIPPAVEFAALLRHVQANADAAGTGAVVFDVETTELIERDVPLQRMEVSVACAVRVPEEGERVEEGRTFWHERALTTGSVQGEKMETLLDMFDDAKLICAYNGREFDMQVLQLYAHSTAATRRGGKRTAASSWTRLPRRAGRRADA